MDESVIFIDETPSGQPRRRRNYFREHFRERNNIPSSNSDRQRISVIDLTNSADTPETDVEHERQHEISDNLRRDDQTQEQSETMSETIRPRLSDVYSKLCCPICLESLLKSDAIPMALKCGHIFCSACTELIILQNPKQCSLCKRKVCGKPIRLYI